MSRNLLSLAATILLLAACRQQASTGHLNDINECLQKFNAFLQNDNRLYYEAIKEKVKDPVTHRDAEIWEPRAEMVKKHVDSLVLLIENLKSKLLKL